MTSEKDLIITPEFQTLLFLINKYQYDSNIKDYDLIEMLQYLIKQKVKKIRENEK